MELLRRIGERFLYSHLFLGLCAAAITHLVFQELFLVRLP